MTSTGDWGEIIDEADAKRFVGREQELVIFRQQMMLAKPDFLIFYISGQAGVGKTTLLNRYRDVTKDLGFLSADCDELQHDVSSVLGRFAHQLAEQGHFLKRFDERYRVYRQKMNEIENDPGAPQGIAALLGRTVVRAAFIGGDMLLGVRKGLEYLPQEALETQASEWSTYILKKFTNKDEVALVKEPIPILSPLFFEDLNEIAKKCRILLCFENFEATKQELQQWLLRLREYRPSQNIRLLIAGRDLPGTNWDSLRGVMLSIHLDVFTEKEAEEFLDTYKVTDPHKRREIIEASDRLPILMSWFTIQDGNWLDVSVPTHDIVSRLLRWDNDQALRQVALLASLPRTFNIDTIKLLLNGDKLDIDARNVFDWLQTMPFVRQYTDGWRYHDVVRRKMLQYQRQKSPENYSHYQKILVEFYNVNRLKLNLSDNEQWTNERWRRETLAYIYHLLAADSVKYWGEVMSIFTMAIRKRRTFALEIIEMLCLKDVLDELSRDQRDLAELFRRQLQAVMDGKLQDGIEMFFKLSNMAGLLSDAKGYAFAYCGECYRLDMKLEKAISKFDEAIDVIPEDDWTLGSRGQAYRAMKRYEEALADFNRAIALSEKYTWIIGSRGWTYHIMKRYEEALADFNRAIALDKQDRWIITGRGLTYHAMKRYEEALADFNRVIALNEEDTGAITGRGLTYHAIEQYEEALADFNRAIALDEKDTWAITSRGQTYHVTGQYEEALADINRVIALNSQDPWAIANRGQTYHAMKRYEEALVDFNRAIALDEKDTWAIASRGRTYHAMKRYEEALADFNQAIALDGEDVEAITDRGLTYHAMERYEEALVDFNQAIALDDKNIRAITGRGMNYRAMERYEEALEDFNQAIALDEKCVGSIVDRGLTYYVLERYEEALVDFNQAIMLNEKDTRSFTSRGLNYYAMERYEEALVDFNRVITLNEKDAKSVTCRGKTYYAIERYKEALEDFNRAIVLNEEDAEAIVCRGQTYRAMGRYEEALVDFSRLIALEEEDVEAITYRGKTYRAMGRYEEALVDFNRAIALEEEDAEAIICQGKTYYAMKRYEEALIDFSRAIALYEENDEYITYRGKTYYAIGRYEEAIEDFSRAITLNEGSAEALVSRGQAYRAMKRYEEALADFNQAINLGQDLMNSLGLVLSYLERYAEAVECYKRVLDKEVDAIYALYNTAVVMVCWRGLPHALEWVNKARASLVCTLDSGKKLYGLGGLEALVGNDILALDYLRQAVAVENHAADWACHDIAWRNLRSNTEFQAIVLNV